MGALLEPGERRGCVEKSKGKEESCSTRKARRVLQAKERRGPQGFQDRTAVVVIRSKERDEAVLPRASRQVQIAQPMIITQCSRPGDARPRPAPTRSSVESVCSSSLRFSLHATNYLHTESRKYTTYVPSHSYAPTRTAQLWWPRKQGVRRRGRRDRRRRVRGIVARGLVGAVR